MKTDEGCVDTHRSTGLRTLLEASGVVGTWDWDIPRQIVRYDAGAAALLAGDVSLARTDLGRSAAMARIHPADAEWLERKTRRLLEGGGLYLAEYRVMTVDGDSRWMLSRGRIDFSDERRPIRAKGILIDVTDSRESGQGYVASAHPEFGDRLDDAAKHCIAAQQSLQVDGTPLLRMLMNTVLLEVGHEIARRTRQRMEH